MAAIDRRKALALLAAVAGLPAWCADTDDVHRVISSVAQALSSGDSAQAMLAFSKDCANYDTLSSYFDALTAAYGVESQVDFLDEDLSDQSDAIRVRWALTLTTHQTGFTTNRSSEIDLKVAMTRGQWRIAEFAPVTIFDPQAA